VEISQNFPRIFWASKIGGFKGKVNRKAWVILPHLWWEELWEVNFGRLVQFGWFKEGWEKGFIQEGRLSRGGQEHWWDFNGP